MWVVPKSSLTVRGAQADFFLLDVMVFSYRSACDKVSTPVNNLLLRRIPLRRKVWDFNLWYELIRLRVSSRRLRLFFLEFLAFPLLSGSQFFRPFVWRFSNLMCITIPSPPLTLDLGMPLGKLSATPDLSMIGPLPGLSAFFFLFFDLVPRDDFLYVFPFY